MIVPSQAWDLVITEGPGEAEDRARSARRDGYDLVVAAGGDGTVNEVARGLIEDPVPLGIVPLGSGNALARALGIPLRTEDAVAGLLSPSIRAIDVGRIGDDVFLSTAGTGIDAEICYRFNQSRSRRGFWPYLYTCVVAISGFRPEPLELEYADGSRQRVRPFLLALANTSQYGYGATIAPDARPDDGELDVCVIEDLTLTRALFNARRLFDGTIDRMPGVTTRKTKSVRIRRDSARHIQVDGEAVLGGIEVEVVLMPKALQVALPAA